MKEYLETANTALNESRLIINNYFRQPLMVENKEDTSPVTIADKLAEKAIRQTITERHPQHGILGEEHGVVNAPADYQWVIDPIDGTKSFVTGTPIFGTLVGLTHKAKPVMGIIDMPELNERWVGVKINLARFPVLNNWKKRNFIAPNLTCLTLNS